MATILVLGIGACAPDDDPANDIVADVDGVGEPVEDPVEANAANVSPAGGAAASNALQADFDGDGFADLAIGVQGDQVNGAPAGSVNVLYGTAAGLSALGNQLWNRATPGVAGGAVNGDIFGATLAAGDFNADGFADLAIGASRDSVNAMPDAGSITVLYGSAAGLTAVDSQFWHQDSPGVLGAVESEDRFGLALTSGDFDGDGRDDLAIGVPFEDIGNISDAGAIQVLFGSATGLRAAGNQLLNQESPGIVGVANDGDLFGYALAAGDFDADGRDDLAIGVPDEDLPAVINAGLVQVIYGAAGGLTSNGDQLWSQDSAGIPGVSDPTDEFGRSLAAGDFDNDGFDDLAVGVPFEDLGGGADAGSVNIILGAAGGLASAGAQSWNQDSVGVLESVDPGDRFGWTLAVGDFDDDGHDDLAIGVHNEGVAGAPFDAGVVNVLYGTNSGLGAGGNQLWSQDSAGIGGTSDFGDRFGWSLSSGDFDGDGRADLAVGAPFEDLGPGLDDAGAVNVIYGSGGPGLAAAGEQLWHQDSPGVLGTASPAELFGYEVD